MDQPQHIGLGIIYLPWFFWGINTCGTGLVNDPRILFDQACAAVQLLTQ